MCRAVHESRPRRLRGNERRRHTVQQCTLVDLLAQLRRYALARAHVHWMRHCCT
jgi:hypothetical protein